jgi:hypothetical protein
MGFLAIGYLFILQPLGAGFFTISLFFISFLMVYPKLSPFIDPLDTDLSLA